ncbi:right-handed parallel beta-helix repeat-containing protein, partial [Candidatus Kuenenbacteria bacterium]|nr:right-handed parallel beta-helix repeat-containing protein [Candidatus Kuenenbacteria bacterium]
DYGQALLIEATSKNSILDNVIFEYGDMFMIYIIPMVQIQGANVKISNAIFRKSRDMALSLIDSNSVIENCIFEDNIMTALSIEGGQMKIKNSQFKNNSVGVEIRNNSKVIFENNYFINNRAPLFIGLPNEINFDESNKLLDNDLNGILIFSQSFLEDTVVVLPKINWPYLILDNVLSIEQGTLIINSGVVIKGQMHNGDPLIHIYKDGNLIINGTENEPVIITSFNDDNILGDTNNNGLLTQPAKNDWSNIFIQGNANLKWLKLRYGSDKPLIPDTPANILQSNVSIE